MQLYELLNEYRTRNGLPAISLSTSLTHVAQTHAGDLAEHYTGGSCNLHSWSEGGAWSSCCYTPDHAQAQCMWDKPVELTDYPGMGFEIAFGGSGGYIATAANALSAWKSSSGHNAVILSQGTWSSFPWKAVGVGIHQGYAVAWFGQVVDPSGSPSDPAVPPQAPKEKSNAVFDTVEKNFPQFFSPPTATQTLTSGTEIFYYRFYSAGAQGELAMYQNDIWYSINGKVARLSTLEEANQLICGGTCW